MNFPTEYNCLSKNEFYLGEFKIIPIRFEDRIDIMDWRNEQMYHLRQKERLTVDEQLNYFKNTVSSLFIKEQPNQILFSFLKNNVLIGYGGLVQINWTDYNLEMSFLVNTKTLNDRKAYDECFNAYISLIKDVSFNVLKFNKLYTETYDLREDHIRILEENKFILEGRLREHISIDGTYYDSLYHSILKKEYLLNK